MIRSAALKALTALNYTKASQKVLPLLKDPALIVRNDAIDAAVILRPKGIIPAILALLKDSRNYHRGQAQWAPLKALEALVAIGAKQSTAHELSHLLEFKNDRVLLISTVQTLERLTGKRFEKNKLNEQVQAWKSYLAQLTPSN